jgi:hypothetical protein
MIMSFGSSNCLLRAKDFQKVAMSDRSEALLKRSPYGSNSIFFTGYKRALTRITSIQSPAGASDDPSGKRSSHTSIRGRSFVLLGR